MIGTRRALLSRRAAGGGDWWEVAGQTCVAAYKFIGAASEAASLVNLANPGTHDLVKQSTPIWDASWGWNFPNDAARYLANTTCVPEETWSVFVRTSEVYNGYVGLIGGLNTTTGVAVGIGRNAYHRGIFNGSKNTPYEMNPVAGVLGFAGLRAFQDGSYVGEIGSFAGTREPLHIGIMSNIRQGYHKCQCVAIYSTTLSDEQVTALSARMAALS